VIRSLGDRLRAFRIWRFERRSAGRKLLSAFSDAYPRAFFLEVGASDGVTGDHLRPYVLAGEWRGLMVEPVPYVFERLRHNYAGIDRVALENVAVADHDGVAQFHHFAEVEDPEPGVAPDVRHALGSFSRDLVASHSFPDHESAIVSTEIACTTLQSLLDKHGVGRLDLMVIDTEGYDFEIIRQIDFSTYRPRVLVYEDIHLSPEDHAECSELLQGLGYELLEEVFDTWCFDAVPDDRLTRSWRRIRSAGPSIPRHKLERWLQSVTKGD